MMISKNGVIIMEKDFILTVEKVLNSPHFKRAEIVAGAAGIKREIKWVHILDAQLYDSLMGNEFILSTGRVFTDLDTGLSFLRNLIAKNVSGLCVELVSHITSIPDEMIQLADEHDFPLVIVRETVNFIDVTRDLHTMIITKNSINFSRMEEFSAKLNTILLAPHDIEDILDVVHQFTEQNVVYVPVQGNAIFVPSIPMADRRTFLKLTEQVPHGNVNHSFVGRPINVLNRKWADVYLFSMELDLKDIEILILDRVVMSITQELLRELSLKEKMHNEENYWITNWINGRLPEYEVTHKLNDFLMKSDIFGYQVCVLKFDTQPWNEKYLSKFMTHTMIVARSLFEEEGFYLLGTYEVDQLIFILMDHSSGKEWKKRVSKVISQLQLRNQSLPKDIRALYGVGKRVSQVGDVKISFETALDAIAIQKRAGKNEPIYDDLHIYRIISLLDRVSNLDNLIEEYLTPVIEYDHEHNTELMKTLEAYCSCNGSKQQTAELLFIVRQTLYLRVQKLEHLLGEDFMKAEKRLAIELALCAYNYKKAVI
jgi:purine catabolism regulator